MIRRAGAVTGLWVFLLFSSNSFAARADKDYLSVKHFDFQNTTVEIGKDLRSVETREYRLKIRNEYQRRNFSEFRLEYNPNEYRFELLSLATINGKDSVPVDPASVENEPLASRGKGFDSTNQIMASFPEVKVGSLLYVKYRMHRISPPYSGHVELIKSFAEDGYYKSIRYVVTSPVKLKYFVNDYGRDLVFRKRERGQKYRYEIFTRKPLITETTEESNAYIKFRNRTAVAFTSAKSFSELGRNYYQGFKEELDKPIPKRFERLVGKAKKLSSEMERIRLVTEYIVRNFRYMGDWRAVNGGYHPHSLEEIATLSYGDCKDLSTVTVKLLRELGIEANVALVERTLRPEPMLDDFVFDFFNHAIVHARLNSGDSLWLDPTNSFVFADGIPEDILGRHALVLKNGGSQIEHIPQGKPEDAITEMTELYSLLSDGTVRSERSIDATGRHATEWSDTRRTMSKDAMVHALSSAIRDEGYKVFSAKIVKLSDPSFQVVPFYAKAEIHHENSFKNTTAGLGFSLDPELGVVESILKVSGNRYFGLFIGQPHIKRKKEIIKHSHIVGSAPEKCVVKSKWVDVSQSVVEKAGDIEIASEVRVKEPEIPTYELYGRNFSALRGQLRACFKDKTLIFREGGPIARTVAGNIGRNPLNYSIGDDVRYFVKKCEKGKSGRVNEFIHKKIIRSFNFRDCTVFLYEDGPDKKRGEAFCSDSIGQYSYDGPRYGHSLIREIEYPPREYPLTKYPLTGGMENKGVARVKRVRYSLSNGVQKSCFQYAINSTPQRKGRESVRVFCDGIGFVYSERKPNKSSCIEKKSQMLEKKGADVASFLQWQVGVEKKYRYASKCKGKKRDPAKTDSVVKEKVLGAVGVDGCVAFPTSRTLVGEIGYLLCDKSFGKYTSFSDSTTGKESVRLLRQYPYPIREGEFKYPFEGGKIWFHKKQAKLNISKRVHTLENGKVLKDCFLIKMEAPGRQNWSEDVYCDGVGLVASKWRIDYHKKAFGPCEGSKTLIIN